MWRNAVGYMDQCRSALQNLHGPTTSLVTQRVGRVSNFQNKMLHNTRMAPMHAVEVCSLKNETIN